MTSINTLKNCYGFIRRCTLALVMLCFLAGTINAQTYVNGNLGTGATSLNGTAAPAGTTWHELQNVTGNTTESNSLLGSGHVFFGVNNFTLADNFTIPAGPSWNISTLRIYSLDQVTTTTTSPYNNIRVRIHNGVPGAVGTVIVFGDLTTNRFASTAYTAKRGIFNSQVPTPNAPNPNLPIFSIDANINTTLAPGNYWVEWQVVNGAACFSPTSQTVGVRTMAGYNAMQSNAGVWTTLVDAGSPAAAPDVAVDLPFSINYTTGACSGTPAPGNTIASATSVCPATPFNLSVQNATSGSGVTYQWQSSPTGALGSFTNITGATSSTYSVTNLTATTFYQLVVTCGANSGTSTPVQVSATPASGCYCTAGATSTAFEKISNVAFSTVNNPSTSTAGYEDFTAISGNIISGTNSPITVTISGGFAADQVLVWIDFNKNGNFTDPGELVYTSAPGVGPHTGNMVIPASALLGSTRMRVRMHDSSLGANATPCGTSTYGQVEDYTVNIVPCVPVAITSSPASASVVCGGTATFTAAASGSLPSYQWEYRVSATAPWLLVPNAAPYSGVNTATLTINPVATSMNGYQYRAIVTGACTGPDFTTPATLTVTPITLAITPTAITKCLAAAPVLISAPVTQSIVSATNNTAVAIPDNVATASTSNIAIAGVPAGANIVKVEVVLNMSHTYPGDMIYNLKAPNGQILNLYKYNNGNGTGPVSGVPTWGWYGAKVSSTGTVAFSTVAAAPYIYNSTTNWSADLRNTPVVPLGFPFDNPTGFVSAATAWNQLASTTQSPNGTWTLAMADGGPGDVGTLSSWSLNITYGGAPATVVFTPAAGLFTDAAGTVPYTGTAVTQVYAAPTANTTYSAVITAGACSTAPQTIQVNVNGPVGGTATLANSTICAGSNATFALGGTLTGGPGFSHNFQVSINNGPFTNIANGGVYSGANTNTLTLTNVPASFNGYRFRDSINTAGNCGSLISTIATLTVNPTPVVVISAAPITNLAPGLTTTLTAAVSPNAAVSYQWFRNGVAVPGATQRTLVVNIDALGTYTVAVTDVNGCTNGSNRLSTPASITIGDSATNDILFIYPSPNSGKFQVRYYANPNDLLNAPAIVNVYDSKGGRVFTRRYNAISGYTRFDVDLASHGKGVYRIELTNTDGERLKTGSVIVF